MHPVDKLEFVLAEGGAPRLRSVTGLDGGDGSTLSAAIEIASVRWGRWRDSGEDIRPSLPGGAAMDALDRLVARSGSALFSLSLRQAGNAAFPTFPSGAVCDVPVALEGWRIGEPFMLFQERFKAALRQGGISSEPAHALVGAFAEMSSNAAEHAAAVIPPVAAFETRDQTWTFSVTDVGCGVVESLRRNPTYMTVKDGRTALSLALRHGVSGTGKVGRGTGFTTLFKSLVDRRCTIRLRSAGVAASCTATSPTATSLAFLLLPPRVVSVNWWKIGKAHCPGVDQLIIDAMRPPIHSISC